MTDHFVYIDSSQDEQEQQYQMHPLQFQGTKNGDKDLKRNHRHMHCIAHNPETNLLVSSSYEKLVKDLVRDKIREETKRQLLVNIEDIELTNNINKRNMNYQYLIKKMEIDQKYRTAQQAKTDQIKEENQKKKKILYKQQSTQQMKLQQMELKKIIVERKTKQQKVVQHLKKDIRKLGFERIYNAHKHIKEELKQKQAKAQDQIASRTNKQRNELLELQQEFQAIKQAKRINKLEQDKNIKELAQKIHNQKEAIKQKLTVKKTFVV